MERQKENKRWDRLIDAILAGDVIPVVGSDFLVETEDGGIASFPDHHKQLIDVLAQICELFAIDISSGVQQMDRRESRFHLSADFRSIATVD